MIKYYVYMLLSVVLASFSQILLKISANKTYDYWLREYLNVPVIMGYGLLFISMVLTIFAFKGLDYKMASIIDSLGYVFVMILGYLFFKEKITRNKFFGAMLIVLGVIVFIL